MNDQIKRIILKEVLHMPKMKKTLLLVSKLVLHGYKIQFDKNGCYVKTLDGQHVAKSLRDGNLYFINYKKVNGVEVAVFVDFPQD